MRWPSMLKTKPVCLMLCVAALMGCGALESNDMDTPVVATVQLDEAQLARGAKLFKYKCAACHSMKAGESSMFGPHLNGIMGRRIGGLADYVYTSDVSGFDFFWTYERMDAWLENPQNMVQHMCMPFLGIKNSDDRRYLIGYMQHASTP